MESPLKTPLAVLLVALTSCFPYERGAPEPTAPGSVPSNLVLRSYEVPNNGAAQVVNALKTLLWFGADGKDSQKFIGRADVSPDGRLIVMATEGVQAGVKSLVESLSKTPVQPKPIVTVEFNYWVVPLGSTTCNRSGRTEVGVFFLVFRCSLRRQISLTSGLWYSLS